jgi:hypothetical protein
VEGIGLLDYSFRCTYFYTLFDGSSGYCYSIFSMLDMVIGLLGHRVMHIEYSHLGQRNERDGWILTRVI